MLDKIPPSVLEWLNLIFRWVHIIAGITWLGQTWFFNWMEHKMFLSRDDEASGNIAGRLWMVHGGGFYQVEKQKRAEKMPRMLHWFKWEAMLTWISGMLLLIVVYYIGGLIVDPTGEESALVSGGIALGTIIVAWVTYDLLVQSPLGKNELALGVVLIVLTVGAVFGLREVLEPRAAYMHVGAMFGTIMVANVWIRIIPGQRKITDALAEGKEPDMSHGATGAVRSKHNTLMSVPLIFIMISSHFSVATYGNQYGTLVLLALILVGFAGAWRMRGSH